jgi:hypothetical protein
MKIIFSLGVVLLLCSCDNSKQKSQTVSTNMHGYTSLKEKRLFGKIKRRMITSYGYALLESGKWIASDSSKPDITIEEYDEHGNLKLVITPNMVTKDTLITKYFYDNNLPSRIEQYRNNIFEDSTGIRWLNDTLYTMVYVINNKTKRVDTQFLDSKYRLFKNSSVNYDDEGNEDKGGYFVKYPSNNIEVHEVYSLTGNVKGASIQETLSTDSNNNPTSILTYFDDASMGKLIEGISYEYY